MSINEIRPKKVNQTIGILSENQSMPSKFITLVPLTCSSPSAIRFSFSLGPNPTLGAPERKQVSGNSNHATRVGPCVVGDKMQNLRSIIRWRKSIIESEESNDDEVVSHRTKVINRISSSSNSEIEEPYANEDLDDMLEERAIYEEEELNFVDDSLDNIETNSLTGNCHFRSPEKVGF
ncbi:unnamed protein product [Heterotrigona itama]|uniref:Uncharacterized protein n=1 Tax=Heterotrigona itama TaxID=395501 RepID=A0A6V7GU11_9HYME|nr:unnamed protein product [Heterotrigona itama]